MDSNDLYAMRERWHHDLRKTDDGCLEQHRRINM